MLQRVVEKCNLVFAIESPYTLEWGVDIVFDIKGPLWRPNVVFHSDLEISVLGSSLGVTVYGPLALLDVSFEVEGHGVRDYRAGEVNLEVR